MSDPAPRGLPLAARLSRHAWWIVLLGALGLLGLATERRITHVDALTNSPTWSVDAPPRAAASPTGFEQGQRRLIVPGHHNASFRWIMEAQESAQDGDLRLRHIDYDARPGGRDVRRTAPYRWWLITVGWLQGIVTGEPLGFAIERGALLADPLLFAILLIAGAAYSARFIGSFAAIGFVVSGVSLFPLAANFQPGAPDPHSLAWIFALGGLLPLLASPGKVGARRRTHFVVAGIIGGLGIWNDATSQMPVLLAIVLGALGSEFFVPRGVGSTAIAPPPWRAWAVAGALTTLAASVFEFAPNHFSWSLDSVSPIHAVVWWGFGEGLHAAGIWFRKGRAGMGRRSLAMLGVAAVAVALWPVIGFLNDSGSLFASDFYALELANHPNGGIAPDLRAWLHSSGSVAAKWAMLLPCLVLVVLAVRIFQRRIDREGRSRLAFVLVATLLPVGLAFLQLREWNVVDVFLLVAVPALLTGADVWNHRSRWKALGGALLLAPGLLVGLASVFADGTGHDPTPAEAQALIERDFSWWLVKRSGSEPEVLFSTPVFSGAAAYYGGFDVVVSSDDENKTGYLTAVRIASATTADEISILLHSRGVTHVALPLWDPALDQLVRIGMNLPAAQPVPRNAFVAGLQDWAIPLWMRPMDYLISKEPAFAGAEVKVFALQAEQAPELGLSRLADFFVERGQLQEAKALRESLQASPRSVAALGAIARIDFALRDSARLKESLDALIPYLSRRSARNLPADRRISLATLLLQTRHADLARDQLAACFETLDTATLRTLTPGSIIDLLALSRSLELSFPAESLRLAALELVPPGVRASLAPR